MFLRALSLFCLTGLSFAASLPEPPKLRLGDAAVPVRYAVDLTVIPGKDNFQGSAQIDLDVRQPEPLIWLNATGLSIDEATLEQAGQSIPVKIVPGGKDFIGFSFPKSIGGLATLRIRYQGKISRNSSAGIFEMRDRGRWYVYTQFEPTDARRAFPCFDEPSFKVPWQLTLRVPQDQLVVSNTPQLSEERDSAGLKTVRFAVTKPLPSYLVAFAAGPFDIVDDGKLEGKPLRIIVPRGRVPEAKFAAEALPQLLKLIEQYFGSPYPYEKLDSVVMPISNFAMENAGMITYGKSMLLAAPENDSFTRQRLCATVMAHEMSHQWVGDLVTTAWWDDIWLNEAFAEWMETKIVGEWKPDWNIQISAVDSRLSAMRADSLVSVRKVRQPIVSDNDIANAFDDITYDKGAAIIRMFEHWIGPDTFRKGVRAYLKEHAFGNATTADFEAAVGKAAGKNIASAFDSFLNQPGVPVVSASVDCSSKQPRLETAQARSLPLGSKGSREQVWQIPFCVKYEAGGEVYSSCELLPATPRAEMVLPAKSCPAWVMANDGEDGYYRVDYRDGLLARTLSDNGSHLSLAEKVGLLGDVRALVNTGDIPPKAALAVVPEFASNPDKDVVAAALQIAKVVDSPMVPLDLRGKSAAFIRSVFGRRALELGWQPKAGEDENSRLLRETLVPAVASEGREDQLIEEAGRLAEDWLDNPNSVAAELAPEVLNTAAEFGNRDLFDRILATAEKDRDQRSREAMIRALGSFRDPAIAKSALDLLLTGDFDLRESFYALLFGPTAYPETRDLPFQFVKENISALLAKLPREVGADFAATLPDVGEYFCDEQRRDELQAFFADRVKKFTGGPRNLAATVETINLCIAKKKILEPEIADFLNSRSE